MGEGTDGDPFTALSVQKNNEVMLRSFVHYLNLFSGSSEDTFWQIVILDGSYSLA